MKNYRSKFASSKANLILLYSFGFLILLIISCKKDISNFLNPDKVVVSTNVQWAKDYYATKLQKNEAVLNSQTIELESSSSKKATLTNKKIPKWEASKIGETFLYSFTETPLNYVHKISPQC